MGRPFKIFAPTRSSYHLRYRLALMLFTILLFEQYRLFFVYRNALAAKYSSTRFETEFRPWPQWEADEHITYLQDHIVANRARWRILGRGWEGDTFVFQDSVIKTFNPGRSPFRNCAPGSASELWPTEIPASVYFGSIENNATSLNRGFLPVKAYFMAESSDAPAEWHLVTPLLKNGNLKDLATKIKKNGMTYRDVDGHYRPAFENILSSLQTMHDAGYCHDDIKPANIFVAGDTSWVLGDLGNLRHVTHPYHSSMLWTQNRQLKDCRANDILRALRAYISFVRDTASDVDAFDARFFDVREPLFRLFWSATANSSRLNATDLRAESTAPIPQLAAKNLSEISGPAPIPRHAWLGVFSRRWRYHYAVDEVLQTRMGEKTARWWAMTWLFGVRLRMPVVNDTLSIVCIVAIGFFSLMIAVF